jgi:uncharacterized phage protein (TIGR02220 family)
MNYITLLQRFSSKKDALIAIDLMIRFFDDRRQEWTSWDNDYDLWLAMKKDVEKYSNNDLSNEVLELFNDVNDTKYTNIDKIKAIIKSNPKVTIDQFASIIYHKKETWGNDPKMKDYLRPATLFGSIIKFKTYLDDATNYWIQKAKHDN